MPSTPCGFGRRIKQVGFSGLKAGMAEPDTKQPDTKQLDALLDSLNGSAERFQTLWFSFLGLTLYLAIAALATTHRNLMLGEPQTLPILNIKVELLPFYVIAPLLYLVFHFYLLMILVLLARTASEFEDELRKTLPDGPAQERYRARVENALFLQVLVGMKNERLGMNALLLATIALITIVLAPLATLILMQMMFLPYHSFPITWWHRGVVAADVVLILVMTYRWSFPRGLMKAPLLLGVLSRKPRWLTVVALYALGVVALCPLAYWLSFREGRWAGEPWPALGEWRWWAGEPLPFAESRPDYAATANGVVFGLFPDRLNLRDETIVGERSWKRQEGDRLAQRRFRSDDQARRPRSAGRRAERGRPARRLVEPRAYAGRRSRFARLDGARLEWADCRAPTSPGAVAGRRPSGRAVAGRQPCGRAVAGRRPSAKRSCRTPTSMARGCRAPNCRQRGCRAPSSARAVAGRGPLRRAVAGRRPLRGAVAGRKPLVRQVAGRRPLRRAVAGRRPLRRAVAGRQPLWARSCKAPTSKSRSCRGPTCRTSVARQRLHGALSDRHQRCEPCDCGDPQLHLRPIKVSSSRRHEPLTRQTLISLDRRRDGIRPWNGKDRDITERFARLKATTENKRATGRDLGRDGRGFDARSIPTARNIVDGWRTVLGDLACDADGAPYVARGLVGLH